MSSFQQLCKCRASPISYCTSLPGSLLRNVSLSLVVIPLGGVGFSKTPMLDPYIFSENIPFFSAKGYAPYFWTVTLSRALKFIILTFFMINIINSCLHSVFIEMSEWFRRSQSPHTGLGKLINKAGDPTLLLLVIIVSNIL